MNTSLFTSFSLLITLSLSELHAEKKKDHFTVQQHVERSQKLAIDQDDLSADVQDLIDEQTDTKLIELLREVEIIMADATDLLDENQTGGATIATQTEIIEKIFDAAKQKQQSGQQGQQQHNMDAMLQMMQNMMDGGNDKGANEQSQQGKEGEGNGSGGGNGSGNSGEPTKPDDTAENAERRVPKNSGNTNSTIPKEFQKAMDAYNKGAQLKP